MPPNACACLTMFTCSSCRRTLLNSSRPSIGWPLTNAPLINRHFASIEDLEEAQAQRCLALQAQPDLIRCTTVFHWWPQRLRKRH
jgi:hypothetical protein